MQKCAIRIHPAVAQEWPVAPDGLDQRRIARRDHNLFGFAGFGHVATEWVGNWVRSGVKKL